MSDHEAPPRLDHENLDVYRCALEFLRLALRLLATLPRGESELRSQLRRAAMSIPLNIAEGAGKPTVADRSRYHGIARGSAMVRGTARRMHDRGLRRRAASARRQAAHRAHRRDAVEAVSMISHRARARARTRTRTQHEHEGRSRSPRLRAVGPVEGLIRLEIPGDVGVDLRG